MFFETLVSPRIAETVARETGAKSAVLDPIEGLTNAERSEGDDYFTVMRRNLDALRTGSDAADRRARHVAFAYPGGPLVLRDVDLAIEQGEFVAVAGPNGGGKTTLLRIALGLAQPQTGRAELFGEPAVRSTHRSRIGYLAQRSQLGIESPVTVREVVSAGRVPRLGVVGRFGRVDREKVDAAIERVGLSGLAGRPIATLSGGQQQRSLIAKALAGEPELLVLDEPTAGVDVDAQEALAALLDELHRELGATVLLVSHEFGAVERYVHGSSSSAAESLRRQPGWPSGHLARPIPCPFLTPTSCGSPRRRHDRRRARATVGFFLVQRRMSLIGDGIGHVAFAGVAAGYLIGISPSRRASWRRSRARSASSGSGRGAARRATKRSRSSSTPGSRSASSSSPPPAP